MTEVEAEEQPGGFGSLGSIVHLLVLAWAAAIASFPLNDNVTSGILTSIHLGNPVTQASPEDPWGGSFFPATYNISRERSQRYDRWVGGVTFGHSFLDAFDHRLTIGADISNGEGIAYAMQSGRIAADVVGQALARDTPW